ncbi:MAG: methyltransferase [Acidobacteria bacterium]|nr:methyltransferase [Acidobacteriota bacterium]
MPPDAVVMQTLGGCFVTQTTYVAAKLGIADLLKDGQQTVKELAVETKTHERSLYRILRTLVSCGIFTETGRGVFANNSASELLQTDIKGSLRNMAIWMGEEPHWRVYGEMLHSVKTGEAAWAKVHGEDVFPYLFGTNRELGEIFNRAMTSFSGAVLPAIIEAYDFSEVNTVADIAGGFGHLLAGVLKANPNMKGVLFDLPNPLEGAKTLLEKEGVADRANLVAGDFFREVPVEADVYILKHIIHDWDDERDVVILKNIAASMPRGGKVLVCEMVVPEGNEPDFSKIMDMEMLVSPGGIERTATEFKELFENAGFRLTRIIPTRSPIKIIEAVMD